MAIEDVFNGAKNAMMLLHGYANTVAQEIGAERAAGLMTKTCENIGAAQGRMMKEQSGMKEFDAKAAWPVLRAFSEGLGLSSEVLEVSPQRVAFKTRMCPLYESARMLGTDDKTIEAMCRGGSVRAMDVCAKQLNPNLSFRLKKFRPAPDDFCEEEIVIG